MNNIDNIYMQRCLQLAAQGLGRTRPNPLVGCVVVRDGQVLSEGFHQQYGQNHAERNALLREGDYRGATLYVNLEPCAHHGKTPPCADLIVEKGISRVVCSCDDPNPLVAGRGFRLLQEAGIEVCRHVMEDEGRELNRRFFTYFELQRPYVILKWAESSNGYMAATTSPYWLSTPEQNRLNHRWRTEEAAILIGSETYLRDHPRLTPRHFIGPAPQPVVLDRSDRLHDLPSHWLHLTSEQTPLAVLDTLYAHGIQSVIVEGGRKVLDAFIASGLYDEVRILRSPMYLDGGLKAPLIPDIAPHRLTIIES